MNATLSGANVILSEKKERLGGYIAIAGTVIMLIGAALWGTSGTDLWATLDSGDMAGYLAAAAATKGQLVANLTVWIKFYHHSSMGIIWDIARKA